MSPARSANSTSTGSSRARAQPRSTGGACSRRRNAIVAGSNRRSQVRARPKTVGPAPGSIASVGGSTGCSRASDQRGSPSGSRPAVTDAASMSLSSCRMRTATTDTVRPVFSTSVVIVTGPRSGARRKSAATARGSGARPGASASRRANAARTSSTISSPPCALGPTVQCSPSSARNRPSPSGSIATAARKAGAATRGCMNSSTPTRPLGPRADGSRPATSASHLTASITPWVAPPHDRRSAAGGDGRTTTPWPAFRPGRIGCGSGGC